MKSYFEVKYSDAEKHPEVFKDWRKIPGAHDQGFVGFTLSQDAYEWCALNLAPVGLWSDTGRGEVSLRFDTEADRLMFAMRWDLEASLVWSLETEKTRFPSGRR